MRDKFQRKTRLNELCWKGIPSNIRKQVWPLLIGNDLEVCLILFTIIYSKISDVLTIFQLSSDAYQSLKLQADLSQANAMNGDSRTGDGMLQV